MAQSGSASALGAEGRGFESLCPDHMHLVLSGDLGRPLLPAHNGNIPTKSYIIRAHFRLRFADPSTGLKRNTIGAISTCFKSARSSTGQSTGLLSRRLQVRFLPGAPPSVGCSTMVDVAQLVEPRIVIPAVAGSNPVVHPTLLGEDAGSLSRLIFARAVSSAGRAVDS